MFLLIFGCFWPFCHRRMKSGGDYNSAPYKNFLVCSVFVCLSQPLKSFEPALGFSRNLVSSVFRAFKPQIQIFKKIRVYLLPFAYVFLQYFWSSIGIITQARGSKSLRIFLKFCIQSFITLRIQLPKFQENRSTGLADISLFLQ